MRGHIRRRGKRSWAVVLEMGREATGRRRQKWHSVRGTKADAERELARLIHELNTGGYVAPNRLKLSEYLEQWLQDYAKPNVSPKTFERYSDIVRGHLAPALGNLLLTRLQPLDIQHHYSQALTNGRRDGRGGLSKQSVLHHHRVLHAALKQAVRWQLLARNPADAVVPPRPEPRAMRALDENDTIRLLQRSRRSRLHPVIFLAVTTGMRRGELAALRWASVDLDAGTLSVRESLEQTRDSLRVKQPKTASGRRTLDLPLLAIQELQRHRREQTEARLMLGPAFDDHNLVFPGPDGRPWPPDQITRAFSALVRRAGLAGLRFHDLRHTHATQLLRQGVHPKVVSERLGHATVSITLDLYSHVLPGIQKEAVEKIDVALRIAQASLSRDE